MQAPITRSTTATFRRRSRSLTAARWLACALACCTSAHLAAQSTPPPTAENTDSRLQATPMVIQALGLSIHPPTGARSQTNDQNGKISILFEDNSDNPKWRIRFQTLTTQQVGMTAAKQISDYITSLREQGNPVAVRSNSAFSSAGTARTGDGQLAYLDVTTISGQAYIDGKLVVPAGPSSYLVGSLITVPIHFESVSDLMAAMFDSITIISDEDRMIRRGLAIGNGTAFLSTINERRLRALCGLDEWTRIYRPADRARNVAAHDLGFSRLSIYAGPRGKANLDKDESRYNSIDREEGFIVEVSSRLIEGTPRSPTFYDTIAIYWMSFDCSEEEWTARRTRSQGEPKRTTGNSGQLISPEGINPHPRLIVVSNDETAGDTSEWNVPAGNYMPQALALLVPRLIASDGLVATTNAYYTFRMLSGRPSLIVRTDEWSPNFDGDGNSRVRSSWRESEFATDNIFDSQGRFVRTVLPDGHFVEPTPREQLMRIWAARGFPNGDAPR